jgi:hypothetical protein
MEKMTLRNFYIEYNLENYLSYSTVRNFIYNNLKELEKNEYVKVHNKQRVRKTYHILKPVRVRNMLMNYFHNEELFLQTKDLFGFREEC